MKFKRSSGILLHPTSLPGPYGIGDLGPQARLWIDFLAQAGCTLWQVLPLGPTGYGDSPYQCFSAFAGNPYLISPEDLLADGLLSPEDLADKPSFPPGRVDFGQLIPWKLTLLNRAFTHFQQSAPASAISRLRVELETFRNSMACWLNDYALFMALKEAHSGASWTTWKPALRSRQHEAMEAARKSYAEAIERQVFYQFIFFRQWNALRTYAHQRGITIIGDAPIFVAHDSADVWAHPELFYMNKYGRPTYIAGVPPDYFSPTGQLWGNPVYRWKVHQADGYLWWLERMRSVLSMVDILRLDHFRGFCAYWRVPGGDQTAERGRWVPVPGEDFFEKMLAALGDLPIIAEDLGVITPDVVELRDKFGLPGMKILQFAFGAFGQGPDDPFLPHHYPVHCVVYTGTHDNDTALGWYERAPENEKSFYRRYLHRDGSQASWDLIRACWASVAVFALAPMQDFLALDNHARMNYPGNPSGNWTWRMHDGVLTDDLCSRIKELNYLYSR